MSTGPKPLAPLPIVGDPKQVELVRKIKEKTEQGRIVWERGKTSVFALAKRQMLLHFVVSPMGAGWALFTVRDANTKTDIMKVESAGDVSSFLAALTGVSTPLVEAVNDLYRVVQGKAKGEIDHAIDLIEGI